MSVDGATETETDKSPGGDAGRGGVDDKTESKVSDAMAEAREGGSSDDDDRGGSSSDDSDRSDGGSSGGSDAASPDEGGAEADASGTEETSEEAAREDERQADERQTDDRRASDAKTAAMAEARAAQDRLGEVGKDARRSYEARQETVVEAQAVASDEARAVATDPAATPIEAALPADAAEVPDDPEAPYAPTPPPDTVMQGLRETVAETTGQMIGKAQAAAGWVGDMIGGAAAVVETAYEGAVVAVEAATDAVGDAYAQRQADDLAARAEGLYAAAEQMITDPEAVYDAFTESYEARYAEADAFEEAYRTGHADLSALREAERIRSQATTELEIMGVETAATFVAGAGAVAKGLRAARIADRLDGATPLALAMAGTQRARAGADAIDMLTAQPGRRVQVDADEIAEVADARVAHAPATDAIVGTGRWTRTEAAGRRVYQRDDLVDPNRMNEDGRTNLETMLDGDAPIGPDGEPINLHHMIQDEPGPMAEVTATFHRENNRALHMYTNQYDKTWKGPDGVRREYESAPGPMDRGPFNRWKETYWMERAEDFR